jgi:hypothetical protein
MTAVKLKKNKNKILIEIRYKLTRKMYYQTSLDLISSLSTISIRNSLIKENND